MRRSCSMKENQGVLNAKAVALWLKKENVDAWIDTLPEKNQRPTRSHIETVREIWKKRKNG